MSNLWNWLGKLGLISTIAIFSSLNCVEAQITFSGSDPNYNTRLAQFGKDILEFGDPASGMFGSTEENSTGKGGIIMITTGRLNVQDSAKITVNSAGKIKSPSLFGVQFRDPPSPQTSDITAFGKTPELNGSIQVGTLDINPGRGLVELPIKLVDALEQISTDCTSRTRQVHNTFVATGRGGLPISPTEPLQDLSTLSGWVRLKTQSQNSAYTTTQPEPTAISNPIVAATSWVKDRNGNLKLVTQVPQVNPDIPWQTPATCPVSH